MYLCSENKGTDQLQLRGYIAADLRFFWHMQKAGSHDMAHIWAANIELCFPYIQHARFFHDVAHEYKNIDKTRFLPYLRPVEIRHTVQR